MGLQVTLRDLLRERGIVELQFAQQVGIRHGTLYQICNNEIKRLPMEVADAICKALDVQLDAWIQFTPDE